MLSVVMLVNVAFLIVFFSVAVLYVIMNDNSAQY